MTYKEKLLDPRWQKLRLDVLNRDNFMCQLCNDTKSTLHIHHLNYSKSGNPWDSNMDDLETLCKECHSIIEYNKSYKIHPITALKMDIEDGSKLYFIYTDEDGDIVVDIYVYKNGVLTFKCLIPDFIFNRISKYLLNNKDRCHVSEV